MDNQQYETLSGRIEGLAGFVLCLAAELEMTDGLNGESFTDRLRDIADRRTVPDRPVCTAAARRMLMGMVDELDDMRRRRQSLAHPD